MKNDWKSRARRNKLIASTLIPLYRAAKSVARFPKEYRLYKETKARLARNDGRPRIFYVGVPAHANLGDLAQGVCIRRWLKKHYAADFDVVEIETNALVNTRFSLLKTFKRQYKDGDFIVFQSGYTTTDLGGYADEMHRAVMKATPQAKMLMAPQTIFFQSEKRKALTSKVYNGVSGLFFLARDRVSFGMAQEMFPDIPTAQFPDIVTTLIGTKRFDGERNGVLFCCRDDSEQFYSDEEIDALMKRCSAFAPVAKTDTTKNNRKNDVVKNAEKFVWEEIESYSRYKLIVTDRYHGTIFSLVAGTPVVIIKTTDHKVTTGAEWFRGVYDEHVRVADSLDEAYEIVKELYAKDLARCLPPYFETEYYDKLPEMFKNAVQK